MTLRRPHHRVVSGLLSSRRLDGRPPCIPIGRPRGVKAAGIRYQKAFEAALLKEFPASGVDPSPWFEYRDANGRGYCQPDAIIYNMDGDFYTILECKLTDYASARRQIDELYLPVVEKWSGAPVGRLVVLRNVTSVDTGPQNIFEDFRLALAAANKRRNYAYPPVFHWLGKGKLSYARTNKATFPQFPSAEA